jgi:hypothetical protein
VEIGDRTYICPVVFSNYSNKKGRYASDVKLFSYYLLLCPQAFFEIFLFVKINNFRRTATGRLERGGPS